MGSLLKTCDNKHLLIRKDNSSASRGITLHSSGVLLSK
jgi:hypothetical protein